MKKLVILFILLSGKLVAQNTELRPLDIRTVTGTIINIRGADEPDCVVILKLGKDSLLTMTDISGHFTFENVKSAKFSIRILCLNYDELTYNYNGDFQAKQIVLPVNTIKTKYKVRWGPSKKDWKVGDKIDVEPDFFRQALVLAVNNENTSFKVHYEDGSHPDGWIDGNLTRPYKLQFKADSTAAAKGLRPGKYVMYVWYSDFGRYQGYFMIKADGTYEFFQDSKPAILYNEWYMNGSGKNLSGSGKGEYSFNKNTGNIKWLTGPFSSFDGVAHLSASIDGKIYGIKSLTKDGLSATYVDTK